MLDYLVIGCGISGLYFSYRYLQNKNYLIIDKNDYIGGRALTVDFHNVPIQMGAGIIRKTDKNILNLLKELQIEIGSMKSTYHYPHMEFVTKNKPNADELLPLFNKMIYEIKKKYRENNVQGLTFNQFLYLYFPNDFVQKFKENIFYLDFLDADVKKTIEEYPINDFLRIEPEEYCYIKNGGWRVLIEKLLTYIKNISLNIELLQVTKLDNYFECKIKINNKEEVLNVKKIIFTGDISINNIKFININPSELINSIGSVPFIRTYTYHNNYKLDFNIKTTSLLDKIILITNNILMACYNDNWKAEEINKLMGNKTKEQQLEIINKLLKNSYNDFNSLGKPNDILYKYWQHGIHYYKPNNKLDQLELNKNGIIFLGEMFSANQGWVEGCIESINSKNLIIKKYIINI